MKAANGAVKRFEPTTFWLKSPSIPTTCKARPPAESTSMRIAAMKRSAQGD